MENFYIADIDKEILTMKPEESFHCVKVLRHRIGDEINFTDGKGTSGKGVIIDDSSGSCRIKVVEHTLHEIEKPYQLHIAIAPTKNRDRFEWFVEKATEIGVDSVTPVICERSERKSIRLDRLESIAIAAMKQSRRCYIPTVENMTHLSEWIEVSKDGSKYIAHCLDKEKADIKNVDKNKVYHFLIGPEGDFTQNEIELATHKGFRPISLGDHRLRTETAGIMVCAALNLRYCK